MKRNFNVPVKGFGGIPITENSKDSQGNATTVPVMLASQLGARLFYAGSEQPRQGMPAANLNEQDKIRCYHISVQLAEHPAEVELTVEDCALIKRIAAESFVAGVYGQIYDIIEG